jgi:hypothetical protein
VVALKAAVMKVQIPWVTGCIGMKGKKVKLVDPMLLFDLPSTPGRSHNRGVMCIGPNSNLYVGIGEL